MTEYDYAYLRAMCKYQGKSASYTGCLIDQARREGQPQTVAHYFDGRWYTIDEITNPEARAVMGLPPLD